MLKIYLTASLFLIGCAKPDTFRDFPVQTYWNIDMKYNECREFQLMDDENIKWKLVNVHPLEMCDGLFGTKPTETSLLMAWIRDIKKELKDLYKRKCVK